MTDPLSRVPGIWRPCLAVELNGKPGRLATMNPGPGLVWNARVGPGYFAGVHHFLADVEWRARLHPVILLDDPTGATAGCLQAFCRELYGDPFLCAVPDGPGSEPWELQTRKGTSTYTVFSPGGGWIRATTEPGLWRAAILAHPSLAGLQ